MIRLISSALLLAPVHVLEIERSPLPDHAFGMVFSVLTHVRRFDYILRES